MTVNPETLTPEALVPAPETAPAPGLARAASVIALGNVASRVIGLLRETVKSDLFGATAHVSAFKVASLVPSQLYDLLIGGMVSSALVPVFSEYLARNEREELSRLFSALLTLAVVALAGLLLLLELSAGLIAGVLGAGFTSPDTLQEATNLLRLVLPAIFFLALSGILTGLLYALKRFTLPAFVPVAFNATIVVAALTLGREWGVTSLAAGFLLGAVMQVLLQLPGLHGVRLRPNFNWNHPGLRRIVRLYLPVIAGLVVTQVSIAIAISLASHTGDSSIAWMDYATFIFQFPLGLVATAVSVAILPTLSRQAALEAAHTPGAAEDFRRTLANGLRLVLLLIVPATLGLAALARPIIGLLYEHGTFTSADAGMTTRVLYYFLLGLIFAAIDQPLVFAFYARKDTLTPALVGVAGVVIYLGAALAPLPWRALQIEDLALANAIQLTSHALIMVFLIERHLRREAGHGLTGQGLGMTLLRAGGAALVMAPLAYGTYAAAHSLVTAYLASWARPFQYALALAPAGAAGLAVYVAALWIAGTPELISARARLAEVMLRLRGRGAR